MKIKESPLLLTFIMVFSLQANISWSEEVISFVGDPDGLGFGIPDNGTVPVTGLFDNRSSSEMTATDGSQNTDHANIENTLESGVLIDNQDQVHIFPMPASATIESATIVLGIGGLQSNDNDPSTQNLFEDELLLDGMIVEEAFEALVQGSVDFDANYTIDLSPDHFSALMDGTATIRIDTNALAAGVPFLDSEPVYLDYSQIIIVLAPLPIEVPTFNQLSRYLLILLFVMIAASQLRFRRYIRN